MRETVEECDIKNNRKLRSGAFYGWLNCLKLERIYDNYVERKALKVEQDILYDFRRILLLRGYKAPLIVERDLRKADNFYTDYLQHSVIKNFRSLGRKILQDEQLLQKEVSQAKRKLNLAKVGRVQELMKHQYSRLCSIEKQII